MSQAESIPTPAVEADADLRQERRLVVPRPESFGSKLLVPVVTALVAFFLAAPLARQWQDRQKARDVRAGLVVQMSDAVSRALGSARSLNHQPVTLDRSDAYYAAQSAWRQRSSAVDARLEAYIVGDAARRWTVLSVRVDDAMRLIARQALRPDLVAQLRADRNLRLSPTQWDNLGLQGSGNCQAPAQHAVRRPLGSPCFAYAYEALIGQLDKERNAQVESVLGMQVQGFSHGFWSALRDSL